MKNIIELKTLHFVADKIVYCDVLTEYGMVTVPFNILTDKAKIGEVSNYTYKNKKFSASNGVTSVKHAYAMRLYHVSFDKPVTLNKAFNPRIPTSAAGLEDKSIPRVCLSDSIKGAISGIPDGACMISDDSIIDTENCNKKLYVGSTIVGNTDSRLIDYNKLYKSNLVFDALSTHEYWWTSNSILLTFKEYIVENLTETFHYIVSDSDREAIAHKMGVISKELANRIRGMSGEELYYYINMQLTENKVIKDNLGSIIFSLGIDDVSIVEELKGHYVK